MGGVRGLFDVPGLGTVCASGAAGSVARLVIQLTTSWLALELTGSPFWVGVVLAVRMVPQLLLGIPAGVVADRLPRRPLIVAVSALAAAVALMAVGLAAGGFLSLPWLLAITLAFGVLDTLRTTATQAYVYDLARASRAASALAATNLAAQLAGALGGAAGGLILERLGITPTFTLVAAAALVGAGSLIVGGPSPVEGQRSRRSGAPGSYRALTLLGRNRLVALLALTIILAEIFGFSNMALQPTFARDVFEVGASGLGAMAAARSIGGAVGLAILARLATGEGAGTLFLCTGGVLGVALVGFAATSSFGLALLLLAVVGAAASVLDTLGQTLLQRSAADHERGAAMGIWVFGVGFGPIGFLLIGAVADAVGARIAQAASGVVLVGVILLLAIASPALRRDN